MRNKTICNSIFVLVICTLMVLIVLPRFNRYDIGFGQMTGGLDYNFVADDGKVYKHLSDAKFYLELISYFRNSQSQNNSHLSAPYCYRPLSPFLASFLPFNEMTSLNILNIIFLIATLLILERIVSRLSVSYKAKFIALTFFAISFPSFYYGTIGYVDPAFLFFLALGFYFLIQKQWVFYLVTIFIGTFAKEGIAILLPVSIISVIQCKFERKTVLSVTTGFIFFLTASIIARSLFHNAQQYIWVPNIEFTIQNITRFRALFSISVTFGIPGIITLLYLINTFKDSSYKQVPFFWHFLTGVIFSILFCFYGIITVYSDGRYIWPLYIFSVPLSALYLENYFFKRKKLLI